MINTQCSHCHQNITGLPDFMNGQNIECTACHQYFDVTPLGAGQVPSFVRPTNPNHPQYAGPRPPAWTGPSQQSPASAPTPPASMRSMQQQVLGVTHQTEQKTLWAQQKQDRDDWRQAGATDPAAFREQQRQQRKDLDTQQRQEQSHLQRTWKREDQDAKQRRKDDEEAAKQLKEAAEAQKRAAEKMILGAVAWVGGHALHGMQSASPSTYATFQGSKQLVEMAMARPLLPALERVSAMLQKTAKVIDKMPESVSQPMMGGLAGAAMGAHWGGRRGALVGAGLGMAMGSDAGNGFGIAGAGLAGAAAGSYFGPWGAAAGGAAGLAVGTWRAMNPTPSDEMKSLQKKITAEEKANRGQDEVGWKPMARAMGPGTTPEMAKASYERHLEGLKKDLMKLKVDSPEGQEFLRSYQGLPQTKIMNPAAYADALTEASLNGDPLQAQILKEQLDWMRKHGEILEKIANNTGNIAPPGFR